MSVYALADLHGCFNLFQKVKTFLNPEDIVYVLGDCGDRGPESWKTIKAVYKDPQFIYLKGNHEDMFVQAMKNARNADNSFGGLGYKLLRINGGKNTFKDWLKEDNKYKWITNLSNLPVFTTYTNKNNIRILLNHSGSDEFSSEKEMIWDRSHFENWSSKNYDLIVHGHTPSILLHEDLNQDIKTFKPGAYWYCDNHKIDLDCGSVWSGITVLFNLDTFEEHIFQI